MDLSVTYVRTVLWSSTTTFRLLHGLACLQDFYLSTYLAPWLIYNKSNDDVKLGYNPSKYWHPIRRTQHNAGFGFETLLMVVDMWDRDPHVCLRFSVAFHWCVYMATVGKSNWNFVHHIMARAKRNRAALLHHFRCDRRRDGRGSGTVEVELIILGKWQG